MRVDGPAQEEEKWDVAGGAGSASQHVVGGCVEPRTSNVSFHLVGMKDRCSRLIGPSVSFRKELGTIKTQQEAPAVAPWGEHGRTNIDQFSIKCLLRKVPQSCEGKMCLRTCTLVSEQSRAPETL